MTVRHGTLTQSGLVADFLASGKTPLAWAFEVHTAILAWAAAKESTQDAHHEMQSALAEILGKCVWDQPALYRLWVVTLEVLATQAANAQWQQETHTPDAKTGLPPLSHL